MQKIINVRLIPKNYWLSFPPEFQVQNWNPWTSKVIGPDEMLKQGRHLLPYASTVINIPIGTALAEILAPMFDTRYVTALTYEDKIGEKLFVVGSEVDYFTDFELYTGPLDMIQHSDDV
jgi:hypothetical protein